MHARGISEEEVRRCVREGEVVEDYPEQHPFPCRLLMAEISGRALHVVLADAGEEYIVVTVYVPDPARWDHEFRRRRI